MKNSPEYQAWCDMKSRCGRETDPDYHNYGGRGIAVHERWERSFSEFLKDVGRRPGKGYSLDRYPNNNGNYEPGNVRWATVPEQCNNTRRNRVIHHDGQSKTVTEWARLCGITPRTLLARLFCYGWDVDRALNEKVNSAKNWRARKAAA